MIPGVVEPGWIVLHKALDDPAERTIRGVVDTPYTVAHYAPDEPAGRTVRGAVDTPYTVLHEAADEPAERTIRGVVEAGCTVLHYAPDDPAERMVREANTRVMTRRIVFYAYQGTPTTDGIIRCSGTPPGGAYDTRYTYPPTPPPDHVEHLLWILTRRHVLYLLLGSCPPVSVLMCYTGFSQKGLPRIIRTSVPAMCGLPCWENASGGVNDGIGRLAKLRRE